MMESWLFYDMFQSDWNYYDVSFNWICQSKRENILLEPREVN